MSMQWPSRLRAPLTVFLTLSGIYLYGFPSASLPYAVAIIGHVLLGAGLAVLLLPGLLRLFRSESTEQRVGWLILMLGGVLGLALLKTGATLPFRPLLYAHIGVSALGVLLLCSAWLRGRGILEGGAPRVVARYAVLLLA